jgi:acyl carrier protein phosphodiesterase
MNYLAHLFLADDTPESLLGNLLGDFMKGVVKEQFSNSIQQGIELHRKIDSYTDSHPVVRNAKHLISLERRRYAGVLLDVFYDHFLAKYWRNYSSITLKDFSQKVYNILWENQSILPDKLRLAVPKIIEQDWFNSYQEISGIELALNRLARRAKKGNALAGGVEDLKAHYQEIDYSFKNFFPDLIIYVKSQTCSMLTANS